MAIYHDTHTERLATNDKDKPRIIGDVTIHPTAQVHPTAVVSTVKPAHKVTSIKQSPVLKGHHFLVLKSKISYTVDSHCLELG